MSDPLQLGAGRMLQNANHVRTDLRLLEVDNKLLEEILTKGVVIKGGHDADEAVMCTANKTFALKYVETTNTQLLVQPDDLCIGDHTNGQENEPSTTQSSQPGLQTQLEELRKAVSALPPVTVSATTKAHIEVVEITPRLAALHHMLGERPVGLMDEGDTQQGPGAGAGSREGLYTFQDLVDTIQASEAEIRAELAIMHAVELDGYWRVIDPQYLGQLLELVILTAQQEGYPLTAVYAGAVTRSLSMEGYHPKVVSHCLSVFGKPCSPIEGGAAAEATAAGSNAMDVDGGDEGGVWSLDERKVCIHFAEKILLTPEEAGEGQGPPEPALVLGAPWAGTKRMPQPKFMQRMREAVPPPFQPTMELLQGEVLVDGVGGAATVRSFSVRRLPADPPSRFRALFSERARWESNELTPFLDGLKVPGQSAAAVLLKYARVSQPQPNGPMFYTAR